MTAVVLAGGQSRRMGRDKTALLFQGETLLDRACRRFAACFDPVWVSVARPREGLSWPQVPDLYEGCGPLAGLHAALCRAPEGVFLLAADLPLAEPALALRLAELGAGHQACVLPGEPLFGWYSAAARPAAETLLRAGEYRMRELLALLDTRVVDPAELPEFNTARCLTNVNDPAAYAALAQH